MLFSAAFLKDFFSAYQHISRFYVAYSGGLDSTVLLHGAHAAQVPVHAVHINHHLQKESDEWQRHCEQFCRKSAIRFSAYHAELHQRPQKSMEELARNARYALLQNLLRSHDALVTAHHQNDLAETLLLQLLRGAGPQGLAAMPECKTLAKGLHIRPLLLFTREQLSEYATQHHLHWIEDPSNLDNRFARNYLRNEIMPRLTKRWLAASKTIARSAHLQAEANTCLQALAKLDAHHARTEKAHVLDISVLQTISKERLHNLLCHWIRWHHIRVPARKVLQRITQDVILKQEIETAPAQTWKEGEIRRYQNHLYVMRPLTLHDPSQEFCWKIDQPLYIESLDRTLHPEEVHDLLLSTGAKVFTVRFRQGGEKLKPFGQNQHRPLKKILNEAKIPPWERDRMPLLYHQGQLVSVLGDGG